MELHTSKGWCVFFLPLKDYIQAAKGLEGMRAVASGASTLDVQRKLQTSEVAPLPRKTQHCTQTHKLS